MSHTDTARPGGWQARGRARAAALGGGAVSSSIAESARVLEAAHLPHRDNIIVGQFVLEPHAVVLVKHVDPIKHMLQKPPAWCISEAHKVRLDQLAAAHRRPALVRLLGPQGRRWEAPLAEFDQHGFDVMRDSDPQRGLPLARWRQQAEGAVQLSFDALLDAAGGGTAEVRR
jgi:hypothetical protein